MFIYNNRLINERFEAWLHGPVCRELYFAVKNQGDNYNPYDINNTLESSKPIISDDTGRLFPLVDYVMHYFGTWSGNELENLTHKKGSAWDKVKNSENDEIFLSDEAIRTDIQAIIDESK